MGANPGAGTIHDPFCARVDVKPAGGGSRMPCIHARPRDSRLPCSSCALLAVGVAVPACGAPGAVQLSRHRLPRRQHRRHAGRRTSSTWRTSSRSRRPSGCSIRTCSARSVQQITAVLAPRISLRGSRRLTPVVGERRADARRSGAADAVHHPARAAGVAHDRHEPLSLRSAAPDVHQHLRARRASPAADLQRVDRASTPTTWARPRASLAVMSTFVPSGVHHILIGPDHILFLDRPAADRRHLGRARPDRHRVHDRAQRHAVARGARTW